MNLEKGDKSELERFKVKKWRDIKKNRSDVRNDPKMKGELD